MTKHTPGPWKIEPYSNIDKGIYIDGGLVRIDCDEIPLNVAEATAHLVAAAPDMLDALKGLLDFVEIDHLKIDPLALSIARSAVAKAEGTTVTEYRETAMTDTANKLRHTAGDLINGDVEDGSVEVGLLCSAADELEDLKADYLRRHQDACDYWIALKLIAEGYGPNHGSKYCRDTAQAAIDAAHSRATTPLTNGERE